MPVETFGTAPDGTQVMRVRIEGGGLTAWIMSWGACLQDLRLAGRRHPLVLGFDRFEHYPLHSRNFGAITGRCANRIRHGAFVLDGVRYQLDRNDGAHHLHGGKNGVSRRDWKVGAYTPDSATLMLTDPAGTMGYPGTCELTATYSMTGNGTLHLRIEARCDQATIVNLAPHSYFNLDGESDIRSHMLEIAADRYLPTGPDFLPTGEARPVEASAFDFRRPRSPHDETRPAYDHNFCLSNERTGMREVARFSSPLSGVSMTLSTTEPGLQFYDGHKLDVPVPGLDERRYGSAAGLCLEPQVWPDAINHAGFPSAVLRPGERYLQETQYRFAAFV